VRNQTLPAASRSDASHSEAVAQFYRCLDRLRAAEKAGDDPASHLAQARQWLGIVRLTSPQEAALLEQELSTGPRPLPAQVAARPIAWDWHLFGLRLAWIGIPFAVVLIILGPSLIVQIFAGVALAWLLLFIFLK
jgi:hypothetical protein